MQVLPVEADYLTYKILMELKSDLSFSEEELNNMEMVTRGDKITWNPDKEVSKEIKIGEKGREIIIKALKKLDESAKINASNISLYEKFMLD